MTKEKKLELQKYKEKTKNMTDEQKKIYDKLLSMQERFESFARELHTLIFPAPNLIIISLTSLCL